MGVIRQNINLMSKEEIQKSIENNINDESLMSLIFAKNKNDEVIVTDMKELVEKYGIDKIVNDFCKGCNDSIVELYYISIPTDEIESLCEKFSKDSNSLSEDEKCVLYSLLGKNKMIYEEINKSVNKLYVSIIEMLKNHGGEYHNTIEGLTRLFFSILEISIKLEQNNDNYDIYQEKIRAITESVIIPENSDKIVLISALLRIIMNIIVENKEIGHIKINHDEFLSLLKDIEDEESEE